MARTIIDLDEVALKAATRELGTKTKVETVNKALAQVGARAERLAFVERLPKLAADLGDDKIMGRAWR